MFLPPWPEIEMGSRRRKLQLTRPDPIPAGEKHCTRFCDPSRNYDGLCPLLCLPLCFSTCKQTLLLPQRPPLLPLPPPPDFTASSSGVHTVSHFRAPVALSILAAVAVFLSITFFLVYYYTILKSSAGGGGSRTPPAEEEQEEDGGVERLSDTVVEHPIWYIRTAGLGSSIINRITVCRYERREGPKECCSVCLSEFEEGEMVRILPKCHHNFHVNCIDTWLRSHTNCPICRSAIVAVHDHNHQQQQEAIHHHDDHQEENNISDNTSRREDEMTVLDHDENLEGDRGGVVGNYEVIHMNEGGNRRIIMIRRSASMEFCACLKKSCSFLSSSSSVVMNESRRMKSLSCNGAIFSSR